MVKEKLIFQDIKTNYCSFFFYYLNSEGFADCCTQTHNRVWWANKERRVFTLASVEPCGGLGQVRRDKRRNIYRRAKRKCAWFRWWLKEGKQTLERRPCRKLLRWIHVEVEVIWCFSSVGHLLPRPPRVAPRPRTTPAGAAPLTPFPMSLSTAALFTDMEKFLCGAKRMRGTWTLRSTCENCSRYVWYDKSLGALLGVFWDRPAPPRWEAPVPGAAWAHLAK